MRSKEILLAMNDIKRLLEYLYMDEAHTITVTNMIHVPLTLSMDEECEVWCRNGNFPDCPPYRYSESMTIPIMLAIIDQLKEQPAKEYPKRFKNRWEEIKTLTDINMALNLPKK